MRAVCLVFCLAVVSASPQNLKWVSFDPQSARNFGAVCNDKTIGGVYIKPGTGDDQMNFLVFFMGGFACWSKDSCMTRNATNPELMSSNPWSKTSIALDGIFSDKSALANFTLIYVPYCTSDSWVGNSDDEITPDMPFVFRGHVVVKYLFQVHLKEMLLDANIVALSGCSAGGRGAWYNLDDVCSYLPNAATDCRGIADAGWWINSPPLAHVTSLWNVTVQGVELWNATMLQGKCGSVAESRDSVAACFFGTTGTGHVTSPLLMHSESFDSFQLSYNTNANPPYNQQQTSYANAFAQSMQEQLMAFGTSRAPHGVFSTACYNHCTSLAEASFFHYSPENGNLIFNEAVSLFVLNRMPTDTVDTCPAINCSDGCPHVLPFEMIQLD